LYASTNIVTVIKSRRMRWEVHIVRMWKCEMYTKFLWENLIGKRPLGGPRRRLENIRTDVKETVCECVEWIHLA
jgi:hypothetical protein